MSSQITQAILQKLDNLIANVILILTQFLVTTEEKFEVTNIPVPEGVALKQTFTVFLWFKLLELYLPLTPIEVAY